MSHSGACSARERGGRMLREAGYKDGGHVDPDKRQDEGMIRKAIGEHDRQLHGGAHTKLRFKRGGNVPGEEGASRPDQRSRSGKGKAKPKVTINIQAGGQQGQEQAQAAHQMGLRQGIQVGARAAAAKMAGAGGPPPSPGGPPMPPQGAMPPGGPPGPPPMPPGPGAMSAGGMVRRDQLGRFQGGSV